MDRDLRILTLSLPHSDPLSPFQVCYVLHSLRDNSSVCPTRLSGPLRGRHEGRTGGRTDHGVFE